MIGQSNRVYEVLNYTRPLTVPIIRRLNHSFGIPADALIGELQARRVVASKSRKSSSAELVKHAKPSTAVKLTSNKSAKEPSGKRTVRKAASPL